MSRSRGEKKRQFHSIDGTMESNVQQGKDDLESSLACRIWTHYLKPIKGFEHRNGSGLSAVYSFYYKGKRVFDGYSEMSKKLKEYNPDYNAMAIRLNKEKDIPEEWGNQSVKGLLSEIIGSAAATTAVASGVTTPVTPGPSVSSAGSASGLPSISPDTGGFEDGGFTPQLPPTPPTVKKTRAPATIQQATPASAPGSLPLVTPQTAQASSSEPSPPIILQMGEAAALQVVSTPSSAGAVTPAESVSAAVAEAEVATVPQMLQTEAIGRAQVHHFLTRIPVGNSFKDWTSLYYEKFLAEGFEDLDYLQALNDEATRDNDSLGRIFETKPMHKKLMLAAIASAPPCGRIVNERCPISLAPFEDPVRTADGFIYSRPSILRWFLDHSRSPMTDELLENKILEPVRFL
mmetsp:Transcript_46621/g.92228  ORF Transcript_46621/g.92228 Transcript_46621/m.92228 type:complete len:404 (+) Transcript_46621:37-1248(+)